MISTDIARSALATNVNAEAATLRQLADWNAFHACKCFAGLWLRFESARPILLAAQKFDGLTAYAERDRDRLARIAYNTERAAAVEFATERAKSAATLAKEAAAAYDRIGNLIQEFEAKYPEQNIPLVTLACDAHHHAWKAQEEATRYAAQCASELAHWIEYHPVWNA